MPGGNNSVSNYPRSSLSQSNLSSIGRDNHRSVERRNSYSGRSCNRNSFPGRFVRGASSPVAHSSTAKETSTFLDASENGVPSLRDQITEIVNKGRPHPGFAGFQPHSGDSAFEDYRRKNYTLAPNDFAQLEKRSKGEQINFWQDRFESLDDPHQFLNEALEFDANKWFWTAQYYLGQFENAYATAAVPARDLPNFERFSQLEAGAPLRSNDARKIKSNDIFTQKAEVFAGKGGKFSLESVLDKINPSLGWKLYTPQQYPEENEKFTLQTHKLVRYSDAEAMRRRLTVDAVSPASVNNIDSASTWFNKERIQSMRGTTEKIFFDTRRELSAEFYDGYIRNNVEPTATELNDVKTNPSALEAIQRSATSQVEMEKALITHSGQALSPGNIAFYATRKEQLIQDGIKDTALRKKAEKKADELTHQRMGNVEWRYIKELGEQREIRGGSMMLLSKTRNNNNPFLSSHNPNHAATCEEIEKEARSQNLSALDIPLFSNGKQKGLFPGNFNLDVLEKMLTLEQAKDLKPEAAHEGMCVGYSTRWLELMFNNETKRPEERTTALNRMDTLRKYPTMLDASHRQRIYRAYSSAIAGNQGSDDNRVFYRNKQAREEMEAYFQEATLTTFPEPPKLSKKDEELRMYVPKHVDENLAFRTKVWREAQVIWNSAKTQGKNIEGIRQEARRIAVKESLLPDSGTSAQLPGTAAPIEDLLKLSGFHLGERAQISSAIDTKRVNDLIKNSTNARLTVDFRKGSTIGVETRIEITRDSQGRTKVTLLDPYYDMDAHGTLTSYDKRTDIVRDGHYILTKREFQSIDEAFAFLQNNQSKFGTIYGVRAEIQSKSATKSTHEIIESSLEVSKLEQLLDGISKGAHLSLHFRQGAGHSLAVFKPDPTPNNPQPHIVLFDSNFGENGATFKSTADLSNFLKNELFKIYGELFSVEAVDIKDQSATQRGNLFSSPQSVGRLQNGYYGAGSQPQSASSSLASRFRHSVVKHNRYDSPLKVINTGTARSRHPNG